MARQTGLMKVKGTLDNVTFYKSKDGHLAKMKTSLDGDRIARDPAFARTRENGEEFGFSAKSGKLLRYSMRNFILNSSDNRLVSRVTQLMARIKNLDMVSTRGKRNVGVGIETLEGKALLDGFEFNKNALLSSVLYKQYVLDTVTGVVTINGLTPMNDIAAPIGATHVSLSASAVSINFETGEASKMSFTNTLNLPIVGVSSNVVLTPVTPLISVGIDFYLLKIEFSQLVNGVQYTLKNGAYNATRIIKVV